jgi:hypothetical protein
MTINLLPRWMRMSLSVACVIAGGALLFWSATTARSERGVPLLILVGIALGLAALGASADFLGYGQREDPLPKIRNTKVYGAAEPASEVDAKAAASGGVRVPLHDQTFSD